MNGRIDPAPGRHERMLLQRGSLRSHRSNDHMAANDLAISVRGLSKKYVIAHQAARHTTLAEAIVHRARHPLHRPEYETFWALQDVSIDIARGEVLGIVGRNGAGKSTFLKVLSRITEPSGGKVELYGRVGSLLEVGTGFHPELTGRENIYLNGQILGMRRREIDRQFDSIVDFAGVEQFIDTPVKRFSSGMQTRLGFSVAAHLNPEILIVDEVLAVGDADFQRKCIGKMNDVAASGRTVLFVSHNLASLAALCTRGCHLRRGRLVSQGTIEEILKEYLAEISQGGNGNQSFSYRHRGASVAVDRVELLVYGAPANSVQSGEACTVRVYYRTLDTKCVGSKLSVSLLVFSEGRKLTNLWTNYQEGRGLPVGREGFIDCNIPRWPFRSQAIRMDVYTHIGHEVQDWIEGCLMFDSYDGDFYGSGVVTNADQGALFLEHSWSSDAG
jgi:lipopolysaccharide transport system ATP-binding protein